MIGKVIQGTFLSSRPRTSGVPTVQPNPALRPSGSPSPDFASRPLVAQAHGAGNAFAVDPAHLGLGASGGRPLPAG
jgi:hypothetical protein